MLRYDELASPCGLLRLALDEVGLAQVNFIESDAALPPAGWVRDPAALAPVVAQLAAYFAGEFRITSYNVCYTKLLRTQGEYDAAL